MNIENAKRYVRENKKKVAIIAVFAVIAIVVLIVLLIALLGSSGDDGGVYTDPEVFQVSIAGQGYGDGTASYSDADAAAVASDLGSRFGTTYQTLDRDTIKSYTSGTNGQWCNYGWTAGEGWPYCQSSSGSDSTCCNGGQGTADWDGMNPQPAIFLYGQKPKAGQIPTCDSSLDAGTQCISNWSAGGGLPTIYSRYD